MQKEITRTDLAKNCLYQVNEMREAESLLWMGENRSRHKDSQSSSVNAVSLHRVQADANKARLFASKFESRRINSSGRNTQKYPVWGERSPLVACLYWEEG